MLEYPSEWESALFPHRLVWLEQSRGARGDKSNTANHFLNKVLPYLAKVCLQDGIFWVKEWPEHGTVVNFLRLLHSKGYKQAYLDWAQTARLNVLAIHNAEQQQTPAVPPGHTTSPATPAAFPNTPDMNFQCLYTLL